MAIGNLAAYSMILLSKAGIKFAERKKWLPASYYNKKAIELLREGDIEEAAKSNQIALAKSPESEKGLIINELILMRRDAKESQLLKNIELLEEKILFIKEEMAQNRLELRRMKKKNLVIQTTALLLFVPIIAALVAYALLGVQDRLFTIASIGVSLLNMAAFFYLSRTVLERKRIEIMVGQSDFLSRQTLLKKRLDEIAGRLFELRIELDLSMATK